MKIIEMFIQFALRVAMLGIQIAIQVAAAICRALAAVIRSWWSARNQRNESVPRQREHRLSPRRERRRKQWQKTLH
jgi:hypothetical protein